jgi:6-phosphogluconolactonase (cycloisomerase 2 family)
MVGVWQGCDSGSGSGGGNNGGGKGIGGGSTATYLAYLDPVAGNVNVTTIPTSGTLATAAGSPYLAGSQPVSMTISPDGKFIYVVNASSGNVNQYAISATGALTQPVPPIATGVQPSVMAIDPTSRFALVANQGASTLSVYSINPTTGVLTATGSPITLNVTGPKTIAINGNFVFVASTIAIDVLIFNSTNNTFSFGTGSSIGGGSSANIVAMYAPPQATNRLYVLDASSNSIIPYTVSNTGVLTQGASIPVGAQPTAMIADEGNRFLYVANQGSNNLSVFQVDPGTGALTTATVSPIATITSPTALALDTVNHFVFVAGSAPPQIQTYSEDTGTGALTARGTPLAVNNTPAAMVVAKP